MNRSFAPATDPSGLNHIPPLMESPKTSPARLPAKFGDKNRQSFLFGSISTPQHSKLHWKTRDHDLWSPWKKRQMQIDHDKNRRNTADLIDTH